MVDDVEYPVDCLIFATGFEVGTDYSRRTGFEVIGRDGLTLTEKWADGVRTSTVCTSTAFRTVSSKASPNPALQ